MILGIIASAFLTASTLAEVVGHDLANHGAWTNWQCKSGFAITKAEWDSRGISVEFETDWEPPYLVALFAAEAVQFGDLRYPIKRSKTMLKSAHFSGLPFLKKNVFVVAGTPDSMCAGRDWTEEEIAAYERRIANGKPDFTYEDPFDELNRMEGSVGCQLIGDYTWVRFFRTYDAFEFRNKPGMYPDYFHTVATNYYKEKFIETYYVDREISGMNERSVYELPRFEEMHTTIKTNQDTAPLRYDYFIEKQVTWQVEGLPPYTYFVSNVVYKNVGEPFEVPAIGSTNVFKEAEWYSIPSVPVDRRRNCRGTRFVHFEDTDTDFMCLAYSARTNRSEEVAIRRPIKAPKGSVSMDWLGHIDFTNKSNRAWFDME